MFYIILNIAIKQIKYCMKKVLPPLNKRDAKAFNKKTNCLVRYLNRQILLSLIKGERAKKERFIERKRSLLKNKTINDYPVGLIENKKKIAIYTVLYGDYDSIKTIEAKNPYCDYYIFTDQPVPKESGWIKVDFSFPKEVNDDPILKNRFLKMHPHLIFSNYEYSIYLDAVIVIKLDIYRLMGRMNNKVFGLFDHNRGTKCLYEEANILKRINKLPSKDIDAQIIKYKQEGFPEKFGFVECTIIIRQHNNPLCIKIMDNWWEEFLSGPKRDQLSFMYCIWKNGLTKNDIACLGATYWDEPTIEGVSHKK